MLKSSQRLKIRGRGVKDVVTISGFVQDAIIAADEMTFEQENRRFVAILNRFMWERADPSTLPESAQDEQADAKFEDASDGKYWRVQSALVVERASSAKRKGIQTQPNKSLPGKDEFHYLLSIVPEGDQLTLYFAGGGMIMLAGPALEVFLEDLSDPWPTPQMPVHPD